MCGLCDLVLLALLLIEGIDKTGGKTGGNIRRNGSSNLIEDVVVVGEDIVIDVCIVG